MPFARKTLTTLIAEGASDVATAFPGADALLPNSVLGVLVKSLAGMTNGLYGYLDWIARQAVPFTAADEYLEAWAGLKNVTRKAAVAAGATAPIMVTFTGAAGIIPLGAPIRRSDGAAYATTAAAAIAGGAVTVPCKALTAGAAGSVVMGQQMTLGSAIAGVNSGGQVTDPGSPGADTESDDSLRDRMLQVYQAPPMGGAGADYITWATAVAGVTRAWTAPLEGGAGTVTVYFMMDVTRAANGGFPQGANGVAAAETRAAAATGDQLTVANALYPLRPVTALVTAKAPGSNAVSFTISGLSGASAQVQAAIAAAIDNVFLTFGAPGGTVDSQGDPAGPVNLSDIEAAIAAIAGTAGFVITQVACTAGAVSPGTDGNITSNAGFLPVRGAVTYV